MIDFLLILVGVCASVIIGLLVGVYLVTRGEGKDDAEQTWDRTAAKETKPPPVSAPIIVRGEPFDDQTPRMRQLKAAEIVKKTVEDAAKRDTELTARLKRAATPEGQRKAAAVVRKKIKKAK